MEGSSMRQRIWVAACLALLGVVPVIAHAAVVWFQAPTKYTVTGPARFPLAYDWDRDGWPDLLISGSDSITVLRNDQEGQFTRLLAFPNPHAPYALAAVDLNTDGIDDLETGTLLDGLVT